MSAISTRNGPVTRHTIATPEEQQPKKILKPYKPKRTKPPGRCLTPGESVMRTGISLTAAQYQFVASMGPNFSANLRVIIRSVMAGG